MMAGRPHILVADDEADLKAQLEPVLRRAGFDISTVSNGQEVLDFLERGSIDLLVLDIDMKVGIDGREVLRRLREGGNWVPVIMFSAHGSYVEQSQAISEGADAYINKPYEVSRLAADIHAILRRVQIAGRTLVEAGRLVSGPLVVDKKTKRAFLNGQDLELRPKEAALLLYLMANPSRTFTRKDLIDALWGTDYVGTERYTVDPRIADLRKALGDDAMNSHFIETVRGADGFGGYRFVAEVEGHK
jgi:DNA-binding response OmpR family regulator